MADISRLPGPIADVWDWQREGLCRGKNSAMFYHPRGERGPARARREERAKTICRSCPVIVQCRHYALSTEEQHGIWGALGESERRDIIKRRKRLPITVTP